MAEISASDFRPAHPELFISYAVADLERASALHDRLAAEGFVVWFDKVRLQPGCDWHKEIEAGCEAARVMLPLLTPRWKGSQWTRFETYGHAAILPLLAEGEPAEILTPPLRGKQGVRFDPLTADDAAWTLLFASLRALLAQPQPPPTRRVVDLPYLANPYFSGRDDDLVRIHEALHAAPVAALTQGRVQALAAMGGVGKTTLANEYARRFWRLYPQILWVDARRGYQSEFALMFDKLFPQRASADLKPDEKAAQALAELNGERERLLVIDNAEDAESVRPWLPRAAMTGCRTLVTSRFADWPDAAGVRAIPLDVLQPQPSRAFLLARTHRTADGPELLACDALARELGYLPLALEQAAAFIAAPGAGIGFAGYLRLYQVAYADLLARGALGSTDYPDPVVTTWRTTLEKLSPESRAVLRLCAWYADTPIPRTLVMEGTSDVLALAACFGTTSPLSGPAAAEVRMRDALVGLARYSMILDATDTTFRVHGLVQSVERVRAEEEGQAETARNRALARLIEAFPFAFNEPSAWPLCRLLLPHQRALAARLAPDHENAELSRLLNRVGSFLQGSGDAAEALPPFRWTLDICERVKGSAHPDTLTAVNNLALCLLALGNASDALLLFRRALKSRERVLGPDHLDTLGSMSNMALCLKALGDAAGALSLNRQALERSERALGAEHAGTLRSLNNLAVCLQALGDAPGALPLFRQALERRERVLGVEHPDTLGSTISLAACMLALGDATGALPLYQRVLENSERVLGAEHPQTLIGVDNLAGCLVALGNAAGALPLFQRALDSRERGLGPEHPQTLSCVNNLASCLYTLGDAAGALPPFQRALASCERVLGPEHPDTLGSLNNLASCMKSLGDAAGALPLFRRALVSFEHVLGADHPQTLSAVDNLANCLQACGDPTGALPLFRRALERFEHVLGAEHPQTLVSVVNLAFCLQALGDLADAMPLYRRASAGNERVLGFDHPQTLTSVNNLACCLQASGDAAGALPFYDRALESRERVLGTEHPDTLTSVNNVASCMYALGHAGAALPLLRGALEGRKRAFGTDHPDTLTSMNNVASCMHSLGDTGGAIQLLRQALEIAERRLGPEHPTTRQFRANLAAVGGPDKT